jgi:hypothetical protein
MMAGWRCDGIENARAVLRFKPRAFSALDGYGLGLQRMLREGVPDG